MPTPKYKNEERKKERNEKWFGRMPITLKIQFRSIASYSNLLLVVSLPRRLFHFHSVRVLLASVLRAAAAAAISCFFPSVIAVVVVVVVVAILMTENGMLLSFSFF